VSPESYIVRDEGHETPCWIWQRHKRWGYGVLWRDGKCVAAHRAYYTDKYGSPPPRTELDHLCENSLCVNPDHLEPVSHTENVRRGKAAILDMETVKQMRWLHRNTPLTLADLAAKHGISRSHASAVINGRFWR
jgi:hypothetical protein